MSNPASLTGSSSSVVHAPELELAPEPVHAHDDVQLLPVLRLEVIFRHLSAARHLPLQHEVVTLPASFDLEVSAALDVLFELAPVTVDEQGGARVRREQHRRIGSGDRQRRRGLECELHRLMHPGPLLVAHASAAAAPPPIAPPPPPPPPPSPPPHPPPPPPPLPPARPAAALHPVAPAVVLAGGAR